MNDSSWLLLLLLLLLFTVFVGSPAEAVDLTTTQMERE
jgi:hypothetical protein